MYIIEKLQKEFVGKKICITIYKFVQDKWGILGENCIY